MARVKNNCHRQEPMSSIIDEMVILSKDRRTNDGNEMFVTKMKMVSDDRINSDYLWLRKEPLSLRKKSIKKIQYRDCFMSTPNSSKAFPGNPKSTPVKGTGRLTAFPHSPFSPPNLSPQAHLISIANHLL